MHITATDGAVFEIDDEDACLIADYKWRTFKDTKNKPYVCCKKGRKLTLLHRLVMGNPESHVDHIDGDVLNNKKSNLRLCSISENACNRGRSPNNTSGYKGVSFKKSIGKWRAEIMKNQKYHFLGYFDNPEDAHKAYKAAAIRLHGEFARFEQQRGGNSMPVLQNIRGGKRSQRRDWKSFGYDDYAVYRSDYYRSRQMGIPIEVIKQRRDAQQDCLCAICKQPETFVARNAQQLSLDHNHVNGKPRAFLCNRCNVTLGHFKEDTELIVKMAAYLLEWERRHREEETDERRKGSGENP